MRLVLFLTILLLAAPVSVRADDTLWKAMRDGGVYVLMRHERAPGTGDPANFRIGDCTTQRNLDAAGRAQSRRTGQRLRDAGVRTIAVLTSQWCRCRETAQLMAVGPVRDAKFLNSFFRNRSTADRQTQALRKRVSTPLSGGVIILVTHQVNITALTNIFPSQGELILLRPAPGSTSGFQLVGRLRP